MWGLWAYCYRLCSIVILFVCVCVCLLVTTISPAKMAEPVEVLFRLWTRMGVTAAAEQQDVPENAVSNHLIAILVSHL